MKRESYFVAVAAAAATAIGLAIAFSLPNAAQAQISLGGPPPEQTGPSAPYFEQQAPSENASARVANIVRAEEFVFAPNRTVTIPTTGTNDMDIRGNPPAGVTLIIDNASITLTKDPVMIPGAEPPVAPPPTTEPPAAPPADEGGDEDGGDEEG